MRHPAAEATDSIEQSLIGVRMPAFRQIRPESFMPLAQARALSRALESKGKAHVSVWAAATVPAAVS